MGELITSEQANVQQATEKPPEGGQGAQPAVVEKRSQKKSLVSEFLSKSPVIEPKPISQAQQTTEKQAEVKKEDVKKDEKEVIVSPEQSTKEKGAEVKKEEETTVQSKNGKITIGGITQSEEDWLAAQKTVQNRHEWSKGLTQRSQVAAKLTDEELKSVLPYVHGSKKFPDNIHEHLSKVGELPKSFIFKDEDDAEIEIKLENIPKEFLEKLSHSVFYIHHPELIESRLENDRLKSELENMRSEVSTSNLKTGINASIDFMKKHSDFAITVHQGDKLEDLLENIIASNGDHPEYKNAIRFINLAKHVQENGGTLDEAYDIYYGEKEREKKITESINENQNAPTHTKETTIAPSNETDQFLSKFSSSKAQKLRESRT